MIRNVVVLVSYNKGLKYTTTVKNALYRNAYTLFNEMFSGKFNGKFSGMFSEMFNGMFSGMFNGMFSGMFNGGIFAYALKSWFMQWYSYRVSKIKNAKSKQL